MLIANLATYPPRAKHLPGAVAMMAPQVDKLNVVLNQYDHIPSHLSAYDNVHPIIPDHDTKDVGKFYPDTTGAAFVFFVDDDVIYPSDFVSQTLATAKATGLTRLLGGYHCSIYNRPKLRPQLQSIKDLIRFHTSPTHIARFRHMLHFKMLVEKPVYVDQIATCAAMISGSDMPPYSYMKSSQQFVDVRLAKWCFENGIERLCLSQTPDWIQFQEVDESIFADFTSKHHRHVADEIYSFAFKDARVGQTL